MSVGIPGVPRYTATEALGVSARRATVEEHGDDAAARWLREHDPRLSVEGVTAEMESALQAEGLTLDDARATFPKRGGKPSRALLERRRAICRALLPLWEDDRRRDYMAEALGCHRTTLWRLLS